MQAQHRGIHGEGAIIGLELERMIHDYRDSTTRTRKLFWPSVGPESDLALFPTHPTYLTSIQSPTHTYFDENQLEMLKLISMEQSSKESYW